MRTAFFNQDHRLRNGWWMLIFIGFVAAAGLVFIPLSLGLKKLGVSGEWLQPVPFVMTLLATWGCTRLRKEPLASIGFHLDLRWAKEIAWGTLMGAGVMLAAAGMTWAAGGVRFELDPARSLRTLGYGFYVMLVVGFFEESFFRGFLFQRLLDGTGVWVTQLVLALFFAFAHWGNPGMHGATMFWATLNISLAAVLLGLAYLRTRSLALPIGIHLGWNWMQGSVLGFGVSGNAGKGWVHPLFQGKPEWLTGGSFGLEASVFGVAAVLISIALLWKWKGSADVPADAPASASPHLDSTVSI
ncbi:MAG: CPBP family intramembrane metalloprotease [Holophagaceae bacterium]|nr:CPBP family intramembrane metalloprotease [Holophagaceae bacterium]